MAGAFLIGLALAGFGAYQILRTNAIEASREAAKIIMEEASADRAYTNDSIKPLLEQQMKVQFLPHSIPSFSALSIFKIVRQKLPEYTYREPTLNPTNLNDRAIDWEADIIKTKLLGADWPKGQSYSAIVETNGRPAFRVAVPEYYAESCLVCHGSPKGETDITGYPKEGGKMSDLGAVISITLYH